MLAIPKECWRTAAGVQPMQLSNELETVECLGAGNGARSCRRLAAQVQARTQHHAAKGGQYM